MLKSGKYYLYVARRNELYISKEDIESYINYDKILKYEEFKLCQVIYKNFRQRKYKNKEKILKWIYAIKNIKMYENYKIVFGTLTFNDDDLKINKLTRRRYVQRFLKENVIEYIANIDYGKVNNREHYHFIAIIKENINTKNWKRIINIKKVNIDSIENTLNYVLKLNNHSFKDTTKNERILQDRDKFIEKIIDTIYKEEYYKFKLKNYA